MSKNIIIAFICMWFAACASNAAIAQNLIATDPTTPGPSAVLTGEYKFPASLDKSVSMDFITERWARVYFPKDLGSSPHPLIVFLHGNHGTCGQVRAGYGRVDDDVSYTYSGKCPAGYVVTPNHEGYAYLATNLASHGYIVVSINANRGINGNFGGGDDSGLNLTRGRLVLRHLQSWTQWNRGIAAPASLNFNPRGTIDFSQVGLMGHSRGGEGVRAAIAQYNDPGSIWKSLIDRNVAFKSIFEIAPVDGQTSRPLDAYGVAWSVLLPLCDGDVFDLEGQKVYDRATTNVFEQKPGLNKATFAVAGAVHNFYNTEWQQADSAPDSCLRQTPIFQDGAIGSAAQRLTALYPLVGHFRGTLGVLADPAYTRLLNPAFSLPGTLAATSRFARTFSVSASTVDILPFEDFSQSPRTNSNFYPNDLVNVNAVTDGVQEHDTALRAINLRWDRSRLADQTAPVYFQSNWRAPNHGRDVSTVSTLSFRVSQKGAPPRIVIIPVAGSTDVPVDFSIHLVDSKGNASIALPLSKYINLNAPTGTPFATHVTLPTVRIPLSDFKGFSLTDLRGIRFNFDATPKGSIYIAQMRLDNQLDSSLPTVPLSGAGVAVRASVIASDRAVGTKAVSVPLAATTMITAIRHGTQTIRSLTATPMVEIEAASTAKFPVADALTILKLGDANLKAMGRFPATGKTDRLIFTLSQANFDALPQGAQLIIQTGQDVRRLAALDKTMLR